MNETIRAAVDAQLKAKGMSRADLARAVDRTPQEISRALNGSGPGAGSVPALWADILSALGLELAAHTEASEAELLSSGAHDLAATLADLEANTPEDDLTTWHNAFEASA